MSRVMPFVVLLLCSGCMVLSHDSYFSPSSADPHELLSPFPGNPWNSFTVFGAPADIITVQANGVRIGLSVRNSASSFGWIGPVFVPLIPIPVRETLETSRLTLWCGIVSERRVEAAMDQIRISLPGGPERVAPVAAGPRALDEPLSVRAGEGAARYLHFSVSEERDVHSFDVEISGIDTDEGPVEPIVVHYSRVRGWRVISLP
jgi:hypothetical protein